MLKTFVAAAAVSLSAAGALAQSADPMIVASDQDVSNGVVSATSIMAAQNGWMVAHRTDAEMKPGPVVGHAPLRAGENMDVTAILTEDVAAGDMLMLMVHREDGGTETGIFEYTLGATEDGPVRVGGDLVTSVVTAQ